MNTGYKLQNNETKKGTLILISIPCKIAIGIASFPEYLLIVANRISDEPMPAADIYYQIISFVLFEIGRKGTSFFLMSYLIYNKNYFVL